MSSQVRCCFVEEKILQTGAANRRFFQEFTRYMAYLNLNQKYCVFETIDLKLIQLRKTRKEVERDEIVFSKYCFQLQHVSVVNRGHQAACSNVRPMFTAKNMWNLYLGDKKWPEVVGANYQGDAQSNP